MLKSKYTVIIKLYLENILFTTNIGYGGARVWGVKEYAERLYSSKTEFCVYLMQLKTM